MKEIKLNKGHVALVDDKDYNNLSKWKYSTQNNSGIVYAVRRTKSNGTAYMHRDILGVTDRNIVVDHIDRNPLNNQRINLRICTQAENRRNSVGCKDSTSKYKGVSFQTERGVWVSRICKNNKHIFLGRYNNENDAATAYNNAAIELHGEFANLNIIEPWVSSKI